MTDLEKKAEEFFEIFTGGNYNVGTWKVKAIIEFAADFHQQESQLLVETAKELYNAIDDHAHIRSLLSRREIKACEELKTALKPYEDG